MKKGVGLACLHYAVQVDDPRARECFQDWIGGYFEIHWSVNPTWKAEFKQFPDHPVTRGVVPFAIEDEWYYHMRFRKDLVGVTPVLSAVPPEETRQRPDGPFSGNPTVRAGAGMIEHVAWARERPDGGRGFGFTGGHWHWNWAHDQFRKLVLNGIAWTAGLEIPPDGINFPTPSFKDLEAHQDFAQPADFDADACAKRSSSGTGKIRCGVRCCVSADREWGWLRGSTAVGRTGNGGNSQERKRYRNTPQRPRKNKLMKLGWLWSSAASPQHPQFPGARCARPRPPMSPIDQLILSRTLTSDFCGSLFVNLRFNSL